MSTALAPETAPAGAPKRSTQRQRAFAERAERTVGRRKVLNAVMMTMLVSAAVIATIPLIVILAHLLAKGAGSMSIDFFTKLPKPVGETGGGLANAIVGTLMLITIGAAFGLPIGIGAGLYCAEHGSTKLANTVRFLSDVLNGLPSIVMGIFGWEMLVKPVGHFSALSGGVSLGAMMIPMVARTTEEMVRTVPNSLREAALALGYAKWRTSLTVVLRTASAGIVTGALVSIARIAGETAPLLFTAFGNQFWSTSLRQPISALPLAIYNYAISPYESWITLAWAGALVLIGLVLVISILARFVTGRRPGSSGGD
jgi:phosphate transport system permease protein